jgi:hypothetical protein
LQLPPHLAGHFSSPASSFAPLRCLLWWALLLAEERQSSRSRPTGDANPAPRMQNPQIQGHDYQLELLNNILHPLVCGP